MTRRRLPASALAAIAALWMAAAGNLPLWHRLFALDVLAGPRGLLFGLAMLLILWSALLLLITPFTWRVSLKPALALLLVVSAVASHFMSSYGVVVDAGMLTNVLQTDWREAGALADWRFLATLGWLAGLPTLWLWRQRVSYGTGGRQVLRNLMLALGAAALLCVTVLLAFQPLASLMRNHKDIRYLLNPLASAYALTRVAAASPRSPSARPLPLGEDARLAPMPRPRILLLVVGETARSDNFSINGYGRSTTPELEREDVASFRNAWSCGTSTAASLPCMFSGLTRAQYDASAPPREGLLDVLQHAGLAVLWIDNQSGCKGVCDRVPHAPAADGPRSTPCAAGECFDEAMLDGLDERLAALDPQRRAQGVVLVLHQMGSHGPAYHERSPAAQKRFLPECTSPALQSCSRDGVLNAYDNSIAYTDHFLVRAIRWLEARSAQADTALVYVSDHGESLGEGNLFLHGMPYMLAPDVQKHVPWITWTSAGFRRSTGLTTGCLREHRDLSLSHDNYFHAVLGLMEVHTAVYKEAMDPYAGCRHPAGQATPH